jgi:hypothetical protein
MAGAERIEDMALWDASSKWLTLVIRADSQEAARLFAVEFIEGKGKDFADSVDLAYHATIGRKNYRRMARPRS